MIWYVLIFLICIIAYIIDKGIKNNSQKKIVEISIVIILAVFSGTRYKLGGWDYGIYNDIFDWAPNFFDFDFFVTNKYGTEIGYIFFNTIIKSLGFNFYGFTLIHSALFYFLLYRGLKKFDIDFSFFIIIFLYKSCIFNTFVSMRQSLVIVILLNALYYLVNDRPIRYLLCILPCVLIHTSSIILLPLVCMRNLNFSKKGLIIYGATFLILFVINILNIYQFNPSNLIYHLFSNNVTIMNKVETYYVNAESSISLLSTIENYLILLLLILTYRKVYKYSSKEHKIIINTFLMIIPIVTFFRSFEIMIRLRDYFSIFTPFVLYYISNVFKRKERFVYTILIFAFSFIGYYRYIYTYDSGEFALKNYQSYLTKNISIWSDK